MPNFYNPRNPGNLNSSVDPAQGFGAYTLGDDTAFSHNQDVRQGLGQDLPYGQQDKASWIQKLQEKMRKLGMGDESARNDLSKSGQSMGQGYGQQGQGVGLTGGWQNGQIMQYGKDIGNSIRSVADLFKGGG